MITNEQEFWTLWVAESREQCLKHMFKYTETGLDAQFFDDGVALSASVEGSDVTVGEFLEYPFEEESHAALVEAIEVQASLHWHRVNGICIVCDDLIADETIDALDGEDWMPFCEREGCMEKFHYDAE